MKKSNSGDYFYYDTTLSNWKDVNRNIFQNPSEDGSISLTTQQAYAAKTAGDSYALFNDEPPVGTASDSYGHVKGVIAFDGTQGFWMIHR